MACLDVGPMIGALRAQPQQFEFTGAWLHHIPSGHNFRFEPDGRVLISAACDCSRMAIAPRQKEELIGMFREWLVVYWQPLQAHRNFAAHFVPPSWLRRRLIELTGRLHRRLMAQQDVHEPHQAPAMAPAE